MPKYLVSGIAEVPYEYEVDADCIESALDEGANRALLDIDGAVIATSHEAKLDEI